MPLFLVGGVLFLEMGGIEQDDVRDIGRGGRADNRAAEAFLDELGEQAAVVKVGMGQQHRVDAAGRDGERLPVAVQELSLLVEAAVDQEL